MARLDDHLVRAIADTAWPLDDEASSFDPLLELVGDASLVLIGEASHATHEFYRLRAALSQRLIRERGFDAVAVEADWPDAHRVDAFVRGHSDDADATRALSSSAVRASSTSVSSCASATRATRSSSG